MDILYRSLIIDSVYDERTRRSILALCESFYDTSEFDQPPALQEVPKLKFLIKTEEPVAETVPEVPVEPVVIKSDVEPIADEVVTADTEVVHVEPPPPKIKISFKAPLPVTIAPEIPELPPKPKPNFDIRRASKVLTKMMSQEMSFFFNEPVDPIRDGVPNYFEVIKEPMDFGTIRTKLDAGEYMEAHEYEHDVELVFRNCYTFNQPHLVVYQTAQMLEKMWKKLWVNRKDKI